MRLEQKGQIPGPKQVRAQTRREQENSEVPPEYGTLLLVRPKFG